MQATLEGKIQQLLDENSTLSVKWVIIFHFMSSLALTKATSSSHNKFSRHLQKNIIYDFAVCNPCLAL